MSRALAVLALLAASGVHAQTYPAKPIRVIATSVAGNAGDTAMRMIAPGMTAALGQPIPIENRPQGLGQPAMAQAKESAPDGYTILHASVTNMTWTPFLSKEVRTHTMKDFLPVAKLIDFPNLVAVNASVPATTLPQFLDYARKNAGKVNYGSTGLRAGWEFFPAALGVEL